jgi:hypothetical protein
MCKRAYPGPSLPLSRAWFALRQAGWRLGAEAVTVCLSVSAAEPQPPVYGVAPFDLPDGAGRGYQGPDTRPGTGTAT